MLPTSAQQGVAVAKLCKHRGMTVDVMPLRIRTETEKISASESPKRQAEAQQEQSSCLSLGHKIKC